MSSLNADERFKQLSEEMLKDILELSPELGTSLGLHEPYDYLLPDGSTGGIIQNLQLMEKWTRRINNTVNYEELNDDNKIDWKVFEKSFELSKFSFYELRTHERNPDAFDLIGALLFIMLTRDYAPLEKRMDAIASRLEKTPRYFEEFRSRFEKSTPVKLWTEVALESSGSITGFLQFILHVARGKVSDQVYARLDKAVENLQPVFSSYVEWLKGLLQGTTEDWAIGREKFEKYLELRELGMTSDEILDLGEKYLRDLKVERERLCREIAPGRSLDEIMKSIYENAPETFEDALEFTKKTMEDARRFVQEKGVATIYPEDKLIVSETPAFMAPLIPFAALSMPAKFDQPQIGVYIVTRPKDIANLEKHLNYKSIRNTAVHEAFPGHFLQGAISNRGSFIRIFGSGNETVEGWAHYCEQMMTEDGFITDKETRLVQINDMIWRAVRIIVDVGLSRGEMSFDEAVEMLMKEAGISKEGATAEVKRYTMTPSYALSYLVGKHLILQLKEEVKNRMGGKFSEKFFHDTITANGYLPMSLLRKVFDQKMARFETLT